MKASKAWLLGGIAAGVLAVGTGGFLTYHFLFRTPEARLIRGITDMVKQTEEYRNPVWEEIGLAEMLQERQESGAQDASFNITLPGIKELPTIGVDIQSSYSYEEQAWQSGIRLSAYNVELMQLDLTAADNILYLELPTVFSDTYAVNFSTLGKDYQNSVWAQLLGEDLLDEDFSYDFFGEASPEEEEENREALRQELIQVFSRDLERIKESMLIEESGEQKEIERSGKEVVCEGILLTLDQNDVNRLLQDLGETVIESDYLEEKLEQVLGKDGNIAEFQNELKKNLELELKEDIRLCFYLDNKDRILAVETVEDMEMKTSDGRTETLGTALMFTGAERPLDCIEGEISIEEDENRYVLALTREAELYGGERTYSLEADLSREDSEDCIHVEYRNDWDTDAKEFDVELMLETPDNTASLAAEGVLEEIEKGKSCSFEIGKLNVLVDGEDVLVMSGSMSLAPYTEKITVPEGAKDFFKLNELELYGMLMELQGASNGLGL